MDTGERATLYTQFLEQAAKEYRCAVTDMPAKMAASRRLSFELYTSRLIEGHNPDPATLRWFLEEEQRCMPPPEPLRVTVNVVNPSWTKCPCCAHVFDPDSPDRTPDPTPPPPDAPPPSPPSAPSPLDTKPLPSAPSAPATDATNVVPLRKAGGSIHDPCPLTGLMPPLKRLQAETPSLGSVYGGSNPFAAGPMPNFEQHHPLPSPYEKGR